MIGPCGEIDPGANAKNHNGVFTRGTIPTGIKPAETKISDKNQKWGEDG